MLKTPRRWTADEDAALLAAVCKLGGNNDVKDWTTIAKTLPGRTNKDCRKRWTNHLVGGLKKGPWDADEDDRLLCAVDEYGDQWTLVAEEVGGRSADQCAKRWHHSLNPALDQSKWTPDEEKLLLQAVKTHGRAWKQIQKQYFSDRASNNVKNRYVTLTRRRNSLGGKKVSSTLQPDVALSANDEIDGLDHTSMTMSEVDYHPYLTDYASTGSSSSDLFNMVPKVASQMEAGCASLVGDNASFSDLSSFVPDGYFDVSSVPSGVQSPLDTPAGGELDQYNPSALCGSFLDQPILTDLSLPIKSSTPGPQSTALTLTLENPDPETMVGFMSYLAHSNIKFKLEIN